MNEGEILNFKLLIGAVELVLVDAWVLGYVGANWWAVGGRNQSKSSIGSDSALTHCHPERAPGESRDLMMGVPWPKRKPNQQNHRANKGR